jgi:hypothetical protein
MPRLNASAKTFSFEARAVFAAINLKLHRVRLGTPTPVIRWKGTPGDGGDSQNLTPTCPFAMKAACELSRPGVKKMSASAPTNNRPKPSSAVTPGSTYRL